MFEATLASTIANELLAAMGDPTLPVDPSTPELLAGPDLAAINDYLMGDPMTTPLTVTELAMNWSNWGMAPDGKYQSPAHSNRYIVMGIPVTALLRYLGHIGCKPKQARQALEALGCHGVSDSTIGCQLTGGRKGETGKGSRGKIPMLNDDQLAQLEVALGAL